MHFIYHVHLLSSTHSLINIQNTQRHNNLYLCLLHFSSKLWVLLQKNKKQKKSFTAGTGTENVKTGNKANTDGFQQFSVVRPMFSTCSSNWHLCHQSSCINVSCWCRLVLLRSLQHLQEISSQNTNTHRAPTVIMSLLVPSAAQRWWQQA